MEPGRQAGRQARELGHTAPPRYPAGTALGHRSVPSFPEAGEVAAGLGTQPGLSPSPHCFL